MLNGPPSACISEARMSEIKPDAGKQMLTRPLVTTPGVEGIRFAFVGGPDFEVIAEVADVDQAFTIYMGAQWALGRLFEIAGAPA